MEDLRDQEIQDTQEEDFELNHSDKLVGVFAEPGTTFKKIAEFPIKTIDWFLPLLLVVIVAVIANFVMMSNPTIKYSIIEKQMSAMEKRLDDMVEKGQITEAQKDQQLEQTRDFMQNRAGAQMMFGAIGIVISTFLLFFIVSGVFYLIIKFGFKAEAGNYKSVMVAYGLPHYIMVIQVIVMVILAFVMNRFVQGTSVAAIMGKDSSTFLGWILSKLDVFSIWFYAVISIAFAKVFKQENTGKYFAMVFGLWLGFSLLIWLLRDAVPFLRWFGA